MSLGGGGAQKSPPTIHGMHIQSSVYGTPIVLAFGQVRLAGTVMWSGDLTATTIKGGGGKGGGAAQSTTVYTAAGIIGLCIGPIAGVIRRWVAGSIHHSMTWHFLSGTYNWLEFLGNLGQAPWVLLTDEHPGRDIGYSGIAYVANSKIALGSSATFPQFNWEVATLLQYAPTNGIIDAEPTAVIDYLLNNPVEGLALDLPISAAQMLAYCLASSTFISPVLDSSQPAAQVLDQIFKVANSDCTISEGTLKTAPYYDLPLVGNGTSFVPQIDPAFDLTSDDLIIKSDKDPKVVITRQSSQDRFNSFKIEYTNRANDYKVDTLEVLSLSDVIQYGKRRKDTVQYSMIMSSALAKWVGDLMLLKDLHVRNIYKFNLSQRFVALDPHVDIVSLTVPEQGLNQEPVRIISISEDPKTGMLAIEAEDVGVHNTPGYNTQPAVGTNNIDGGNSPASVNVPAIFEPTSAMVAGIPAIWIGLSGQFDNLNWAGCYVYYSEDGGSTYQLLGQIKGAAVQGSALNTLPAYPGTNPDIVNTLEVDLSESGGSLISISNTLADANNNLCWFNGEFLSFTTEAPLIAPDQFSLTRLNRGLFDSTAAGHVVGEPFCWLGVLQNLAPGIFIWEYPTRLVGQTIMFKFTSFNLGFDQIEDLSTVAAYPYTVSGAAFSSGPGSQQTAQAYGFGTAPVWTAATIYEIGDLITDANGNGESVMSIGGVEWNYNSSHAAHPGLALFDFVWPSIAATPVQTELLSAAQDWTCIASAIRPLGAVTIELRSVGVGSDVGSSTSCVINAPPGLQVGDFLWAQVVMRNAGAAVTVTPPAGWTLLSNFQAGNVQQAVFYKPAVTADVTTPTYTFTLSSAKANNGSTAAYIGADTTFAQAAVTTSGSSTAPASGSLTPSGVPSTILNFFAWASTAQMTIGGTSGASAPTWSLIVGDNTQDSSITWENVGPVIPYGMWQTVATVDVTVARKSNHVLTTLDGTWSYANFQPGDKAHWQVLNGTKVVAKGKIALTAGAEQSQENVTALFSRHIRHLLGAVTLTAQLKITNGSGSGTFNFTLSDAVLSTSVPVAKGVHGV